MKFITLALLALFALTSCSDHRGDRVPSSTGEEAGDAPRREAGGPGSSR